MKKLLALLFIGTIGLAHGQASFQGNHSFELYGGGPNFLKFDFLIWDVGLFGFKSFFSLLFLHVAVGMLDYWILFSRNLHVVILDCLY